MNNTKSELISKANKKKGYYYPLDVKLRAKKIVDEIIEAVKNPLLKTVTLTVADYIKK